MVDKRPALFLDRDGVINIDHGYVCKPENFDFVEGIFELVANANDFGYLVVVVTNQAGIGRGYYTEADFHALTNWMCSKFAARGGGIDAVYYCPYHPKHGIGEYKCNSDFRKPGPGMLLKAKSDLQIDMNKSIMIGDKVTDMVAASAAGIARLILFSNEEGCNKAIRINRLIDAQKYLLQSY